MKQVKVVSAMTGIVMLALAGGVHAADMAKGKQTASTCVGCHGANGIASNPVWPNLAGQNTAYLVSQLKAFKDGTRKNELMSPMAQSLSDEDVQNVAAYFNSLGK